jgi:hypothetical protein
MEITYRATAIKWAVMVEEAGVPVEEVMDKITSGGEYHELKDPLTCERIEKARHFIFDELVIHYREWGYTTIEAAVTSYVNHFHASTKTKNAMIRCVLSAYGRKGGTT